MKEGSARTSTRWGAKVERSIVGFTTVDVDQFGDMKLLAPQQLALSLYAVTDAPIPGISVEWILQFGNGSMNFIERFTVAAVDALASVPVLLLRSASSVQVSARIRSIVPETKVVRAVVSIAPTSPSWKTDITCREET